MAIPDLPDNWTQDSTVVTEVLTGTFAPVLYGTFASCLACGLILVLAFQYFQNSTQGRLLHRLLVVAVVVVSLVDTILGCHWSARWALALDPRLFVAMPLEFGLQLLCCTLAILLNQLFFARRVFSASLHQARYLVTFILTLTLTLFGINLFLVYHTLHATYLKQFIDPIRILVAATGLTILNDLIISVSTCYYLIYRRRKDKSLVTGSSRITNIALLLVRCNVLVTAAQLCQLGLIFETTGVVESAIGLVLPKIYFISILGSLLARLPSPSPLLPLTSNPSPFSPRTPRLAPLRDGFVSFFSALGLSTLADGKAGGIGGRGSGSGKEEGEGVRVDRTVDVTKTAAEEEEPKIDNDDERPPSPTFPAHFPTSPTFSHSSTISTTASAHDRRRISPFSTEGEIEEAIEASGGDEVRDRARGGCGGGGFDEERRVGLDGAGRREKAARN